MTPGTVFLDRLFRQHDGTVAPKYFAVLNDKEAGIFVAVRFTSKPHGRNISFGCQLRDRLPNFHLPLHSCQFLKQPTWVVLDEYSEFSRHELYDRMLKSEMVRIGELEKSIAIALIECAAASNDISAFQRKLVAESLTRFR